MRVILNLDPPMLNCMGGHGATKTFPWYGNVLSPIIWRTPSLLDNLIRSTPVIY